MSTLEYDVEFGEGFTNAPAAKEKAWIPRPPENGRYRVKFERLRAPLPDWFEWDGAAIVFDSNGTPRRWWVEHSRAYGLVISSEKAAWIPQFVIDAFREEGLLPKQTKSQNTPVPDDDELTPAPDGWEWRRDDGWQDGECWELWRADELWYRAFISIEPGRAWGVDVKGELVSSHHTKREASAEAIRLVTGAP